MLYNVEVSRMIASDKNDNFNLVVVASTEEEAKTKAENCIKKILGIDTKAWYCRPIDDGIYVCKRYKSIRYPDENDTNKNV